MHSWAEVEHDPVYKNRLGTYPTMNMPSRRVKRFDARWEVARGCKRCEGRIQTESQPFSNHYELAYLYDYLRQTTPHGTEPFIGRADILFRLSRFSGWIQ